MALEAGVSPLYRLNNCVLNQLIDDSAVATIWIAELVVGICEFLDVHHVPYQAFTIAWMLV